jgi:hypothetical protein
MPFLENCLAAYKRQPHTLKRTTYHVVDFANIMHDLKDWGKFLNKVLSIPESDIVVVVGKPVTVNDTLYDAKNLANTKAASRLGKNLFVYVITYKSSISSNIDDILFWFIVYCVFISFPDPKIHIHTLDAQPLNKDSTYLSNPSFQIHEVTPKGAVHRLQTQRTCVQIVKSVMHTTPAYNLKKTVPRLVRTIAKNPRMYLKRTKRLRPLYFFAYIKYIQSKIGISKL